MKQMAMTSIKCGWRNSTNPICSYKAVFEIVIIGHRVPNHKINRLNREHIKQFPRWLNGEGDDGQKLTFSPFRRKSLA